MENVKFDFDAFIEAGRRANGEAEKKETNYEKGFNDGVKFLVDFLKKSKEKAKNNDFVMRYEDGIFKCKYSSGKEFESVDGKTWKEVSEAHKRLENIVGREVEKFLSNFSDKGGIKK